MSSNTEHAGARSHWIIFERLKTDATGLSSGHIDETNPNNWAPYAARAAEVYTKGSREFFRREQVAAEVTHKIKVPWDEELWDLLGQPNASKDRIKLEGRLNRIFNMSGPPVNENESDEYISFPCVEVK